MQPKESKSTRHFYFSIAKSLLRITGCTYLFYGDYKGAAILLAFAEGLGIAEEF